MANTTENNNINIYVVTYNCNNMKLTGDNVKPSIENFITMVIKNNKSESESESKSEYVPIYKPAAKSKVNTGDQTKVNINEKNIFIFGIQEAPRVSSDKYKHMLKTIISELNNNKNISQYYNYYYFDLLFISKTKLFIIYNDENISVSNDEYYNLSESIKNIGNKHILKATINYNDQPMVTVITTHLRKDSLDTFFVNDLQQVLDDKNDYKDNIILFGDLNSRTLYKASRASIFKSYNDVKLNTNQNSAIIGNLKQLKDKPLSSLTDTNNPNNYPKYANMIYKDNYYANSSINFNNATNTLNTPTYSYHTDGIGISLNVQEDKNFKVPSYPDRVLYKSEKITFENATVMQYEGSDHLPVTVKFSYNINNSTPMKKIYFMRHGHSCSNFIKYSKNNLSLNELRQFDNIKKHDTITKVTKMFSKSHLLIKNPNLSFDGYHQTQQFVTWRKSTTNNIFNLNNEKLIVFSSPLVRAMETAYLSYPYKVTENNNAYYYTYRTFSYKYYNFSDNNFEELDHKYIYVIPFIKELGDTRDNKLPIVRKSITKITKFLTKIKLILDDQSTIKINDLDNNIVDGNIPGNDQPLPTINSDMLHKFIDKIPNNNNNYVFVSHNKYLQKTLKIKDKIKNTMIITKNNHLIYEMADTVSNSDNTEKNKAICMNSFNNDNKIIFINI